MTKIRSAENVDLICARIVDGLNLREIGNELGCTASAIAHWLDEDADFAQRYVRAKDAAAEVMAADIIDIADDGKNDWMTRAGSDGETIRVVDHEHIQRSRLRVDSRKWLMAKMAPKRYGDRSEVAMTGKDGKDLIPPEFDPVKAALAILNLLQAARPKEGGER